MTTAVAVKTPRKIANPACKTTLARVGHTDNRWYVVDAAGKTLGRLASEVAVRLMGKHKPTYTPTVDVGDHIIVLNTSKLTVTGKKAQQREYDYYTYHTHGRKVTPLGELLAKHPNKVFELSVKRMLPKTRMGVAMFRKLHCYRDGDHVHVAQRPEKLEL